MDSTCTVRVTLSAIVVMGFESMSEYLWITECTADQTRHHWISLNLRVYTIPIGQGDCNFIERNDGKNMIMFDCGSTGDNIFNNVTGYKYLCNFFRHTENLTILISHAHADHHNMIQNIYGNTHAQNTTARTPLGGKKDYKPRQNAANVIFLQGQEVRKHNFCDNSNILFEIHVVPGNTNTHKKNEKGMWMKLSCKTCASSLLFTRDMEGPTAKALTDNQKSFLNATHYKMAHHGASALANEEDWLKSNKSYGGACQSYVQSWQLPPSTGFEETL